MATSRHLVSRRQLAQREQEWFQSSKHHLEEQMRDHRSRVSNELSTVCGSSSSCGGNTETVLTPVKYMLSQTASAVSIAEERLRGAQRRDQLYEYAHPGPAGYAPRLGSSSIRPDSTPQMSNRYPGQGTFDGTSLPLIGSDGDTDNNNNNNVVLGANNGSDDSMMWGEPRRSQAWDDPAASCVVTAEQQQQQQQSSSGSESLEPLAKKKKKDGKIRTLNIAGACPITTGGSGRKRCVRPEQLKSHANIIKQVTDKTQSVAFCATSTVNAHNHEQNVATVSRIIEQLHLEMHDLEDQIFFLEHIQLAKMIVQVLINRAKAMCIKAWRVWNGTCDADVGEVNDSVLAELRVVVQRAKDRRRLADETLVERMRELADAALGSLDTRKRAFLVGIFSKNGPVAKRWGFLRWKAYTAFLKKQTHLWGFFFAKIANIKLNMAWKKWRTVVHELAVPPDALLDSLEADVRSRRDLAQAKEQELEVILQSQTDLLISAMGETRRRQLRRTLSKMFTRHAYLAFKLWSDKARVANAWRALQIKVLHKMLRSFLNIGWKTWCDFVHEYNAMRDAREELRLKGHVQCLEARIEKIAGLLNQQAADCEQMRESVELQARAASRVAHHRLRMMDEFSTAFALATEDLEPKEPPTMVEGRL